MSPGFPISPLNDIIAMSNRILENTFLDLKCSTFRNLSNKILNSHSIGNDIVTFRIEGFIFDHIQMGMMAFFLVRRKSVVRNCLKVID